MTCKIKIYLWLLLSFSSSALWAAKLSGHVANYRGQELKIYRITNFITGEKEVLDACTVSPDDKYTFSFSASATQIYCIDLGRIRAQIILEPEQELSIDLPDYAPISKLELLNPYFSQEKILLYTEDKNDLNHQLMSIELAFSQQLTRLQKSVNPQVTARSAIDSMTLLSSQLSSDFLKIYLDYSCSFFHQLTQPENTSLIKKKYFKTREPHIDNPAFTQLFSSEYENPFIAPDGRFHQEVSQAIISDELPADFIQQVAQTHHIEKNDMAALLAVKGFYDAAQYAPNYQANITHLMHQLETQIPAQNIKDLCRTSREKIEKLMVGNPAPYYELYTPKGKKVPTVLKRRYVLLAFVNTNLIECQRHLQLLEHYKKQYKRQVEIVVVAVHQDREELERFLRRNDFDKLYFTLWDNNEALIDDYDVKALPRYFLIGKDGNFIYSPLSSPEEHMQEELEAVIGS